MAPPSITGKSPPLSLITGKPSPLSLITGKPVIVRVKRKAFQAKLDAFWLEIDERPHKKAFLGLGNLSISDCGTGKVLNELASKKILVQHLETVGHSQSVKDVLHSFLQPSRNSKEFKGRSDHRSLYKPDKKHDQLRSKAIKEHEDLTRSSRFEQIWKKRGSIDEEEYSLHEKCHLYDVVRVDAEDETHQRVPKAKDAPEVDGAMFDKYLSLLREFLPQAVEEIEHYKATTEECKFIWRTTMMMVYHNLIMKVMIQMLRTIHGMIIVMKRRQKMKMRMKVLSVTLKILTQIMNKKLPVKRMI